PENRHIDGGEAPAPPLFPVPRGRAAMTVTWRGVFPASTTQFRADQALDLPATAAHVERLVRAGVHGVIMLGTVGETCSLEPRDKLDVLKATVEQVAGR